MPGCRQSRVHNPRYNLFVVREDSTLALGEPKRFLFTIVKWYLYKKLK
jgi:hypothetical protein